MKAISIRQPWAWLIINAGKDIENRTWPTNFKGRVLVHAAKGMTRDEYERVWLYLRFKNIAVELPSFESLERGGIVGSVDITGCVTKSDSPWFMGDYGFTLANPKRLDFIPCRGALGFFEVAT